MVLPIGSVLKTPIYHSLGSLLGFIFADLFADLFADPFVPSKSASKSKPRRAFGDEIMWN
jgi:hypothetical protein